MNRPDPIPFLPAVVDTKGRLCDDFSRSLFLHTHRETSTLVNEILEESDQFRFLRVESYPNIKGSVGLILAKTSDMRISIPLDLSSRPFIPLPCAKKPQPRHVTHLQHTGFRSTPNPTQVQSRQHPRQGYSLAEY
jgi:hypothetical protein